MQEPKGNIKTLQFLSRDNKYLDLCSRWVHWYIHKDVREIHNLYLAKIRSASNKSSQEISTPEGILQENQISRRARA